jgi:large subunit ribosomal protein L17
MPATPRRSRRFGGDAAHQRLMMANLAASLFAAEAIVTTEAKAKALRPIAEKLITKAKRPKTRRWSAVPLPRDRVVPRRP